MFYFNTWFIRIEVFGNSDQFNPVYPGFFMAFTHVYTLLCTMKPNAAQRLHVYTCTYRDYNNILLL